MKCIIICVMLFITSCDNVQTENDLGGIYTASYEHEFGKTDDTLTVSKVNNGEDIYQISRHSGVIKKLDGKEFPKEIITETWNLKYDPGKQTLTELKKGKMLIWNSSTESLKLGNTEYLRVAAR